MIVVDDDDPLVLDNQGTIQSVNANSNIIRSSIVNHNDNHNGNGNGNGNGNDNDVAMMLDTLDEPVSETLWRDVKRVGYKLGLVLVPRDGGVAALRDWDLWGPLLLCLALAILLSAQVSNKQSALVFSIIFVIVWCGAAVVTVNAVLLGGNLSFFQSVCVLGYCTFPLFISAVLCFAWGSIIYRIIVCIVGFLWATKASYGFIQAHVPNNRKILALYPLFLFYISISWIILISTGNSY